MERAAMPYRDKTVLKPISRTTVELLKAYRRAEGNPELRNWYLSIINHICRELEDFIEPYVSKAATKQARSLGRPDLNQFHWDDQRRKMRDTGKNKMFHWEHVVPVAQLKRSLLALRPVTPESVEGVLKQADIAWILKSERTKLDYEHRHKGRDNLHAAKAVFHSLGIELAPPRPSLRPLRE
jgi:hypothetical protein